jgi:hypothetical protein
MVDEKDKIILDLKLKLEKSSEIIEHLKSKIYRLQVANVHLLKVIKDCCDMLYDKLIKEYEDLK